MHLVQFADGPHEIVLTVMCVSRQGLTGRVFYLVARDLTKLRVGSTELENTEALLAQSEELANVGSWEHNFETNTLTWSAHFFKMLGIPLEAGPVPDASTVIHPEDWKRAERDAERARVTGEPFENELRFLTPHRGTRVFHSRAIVIRDASGRISRIRGMSQDVTEQREAEQSLREREALLSEAEEIANLGSYRYVYETNSIAFSPNLHTIYGFEPGAQWSLDQFWSLVHPDERRETRRLVEDAYKKKISVEYDIRLQRRDGVMRHLHVRDVPLVNMEGGDITRRIGVVQDITEQREAEQKLREREALLAHAEEIANFGSYQYDCDAQSATLSPNLRRLYGIEPETPWSASSYWDRVHPQDRREAQKILAAATKQAKPFEYMARFMTPRGMRVHFVRGTVVSDPGGQAQKRIGVIQDITEQVRKEDELRRLSQELPLARDKEQRRIARELHESAGQTLAALKMTLGRLRDILPDGDTPERALLRSAADLADGAVREVRTISYLMYPPLLDESGLLPALRWFARGFAERSGIQVRVDVSADLPRQPREIETTIFRIVQEALTNVHRYSGSRTAEIRVCCEDGNIIAEVQDHGIGLPTPTRATGAPTDRGVGIAGMRERVKQLNGIFEINGTAGKGTTVRAVLPVKPKQAPEPSIIRAHLVSSRVEGEFA
jgi:PAS domain S-box-containing protein